MRILAHLEMSPESMTYRRPHTNLVLLSIQICLLSATVESFLAGDREAAIPGAICPELLFVACRVTLPFLPRPGNLSI